jgi:hypothetical protein
MLWSATGDHCSRNWTQIYRLLHQAVEQQPTSLRFATIEPECKLIQIVGEVRSANCALMNSKPPSVQQGSNKVNSWHRNMSWVFACRDVGNNVFISEPVKSIVADPSIGIDLCSCHHVRRNKLMKARAGYVWNNRHSYSARTTTTDFCAYCHNRFSFRATTANLLANTSNISFVDLNTSSQLFWTWAHHCSAQLMKPTPCRMVTTQPKNPLQTQSAGTILLARDKPYCQKPCTEGLMRSVKQCPCNHGSLPLTPSTKIKAAPHQPRVIGAAPAAGARKTIRPPQSRNVVKASFLAPKPLVEIVKRSRIIDTDNWALRLFHAHILYLVVG